MLWIPCPLSFSLISAICCKFLLSSIKVVVVFIQNLSVCPSDRPSVWWLFDLNANISVYLSYGAIYYLNRLYICGSLFVSAKVLLSGYLQAFRPIRTSDVANNLYFKILLVDLVLIKILNPFLKFYCQYNIFF